MHIASSADKKILETMVKEIENTIGRKVEYKIEKEDYSTHYSLNVTLITVQEIKEASDTVQDIILQS